MILLLEFCENKVREEPDIESMEKWVKAGALFVISYVLSLRGNEGILLDIEGLQQFDQERNELLAVPLVGKLKGSGQVKRHILRSVKVTSSGINVNWWMTYLRQVVELNGRNRGPVFTDKDGFVWTSVTINEMFHEGLEYIYEHHKALFPFGITSADDVRLHYGVYRSFCRGSDSRAISQGVSELDIQVINRWSKG